MNRKACGFRKDRFEWKTRPAGKIGGSWECAFYGINGPRATDADAEDFFRSNAGMNNKRPEIDGKVFDAISRTGTRFRGDLYSREDLSLFSHHHD